MPEKISRKVTARIMEDFSRWMGSPEEQKTSCFEYIDTAIQVFVEFYPPWFGRLEIKAIDILDADYEPVETKEVLQLCRYIAAEVNHCNRAMPDYADGWDMQEELAREKYYQQKYRD